MIFVIKSSIVSIANGEDSCVILYMLDYGEI